MAIGSFIAILFFDSQCNYFGADHCCNCLCGVSFNKGSEEIFVLTAGERKNGRMQNT